MGLTGNSLLDIDINKPRYDQSTYIGRAKHFILVTNPLNIFVLKKTLEEAKSIVTKHKNRQTLPDDLTEDQLWKAKTLYDSAYHPDTGELMFVLGRMSAQVPMNLIITAGMLTFYKSTPAVVFWQWINQSFNAIVNYTNRSGDAPLSNKQLGISYVGATSGALITALGLNRLVKNAPPVVGRLVPFVAVAAANCVNIPLMRSQELKEGTPVLDENGNKVGSSKVAARHGIAQVIFSRVCMAAPGMVTVPVVISHLERRGTLKRKPWILMPVQLLIIGFCLTFATPLACAVFKQYAEIKVSSVEPEIKKTLEKRFGSTPSVLYYNKGL